MDSRTPLLSRPLSEAFCLITRADGQKVSNVETPGSSVVSCAEFLRDVQRLARLLPEGGYAINLCSNRYAFLVSFCAVIVSGATNLLPPNKNKATQQLLSEQYPKAYAITNGDVLVAEGIELMDVDSVLRSVNSSPFNNDDTLPMVPIDHLAAISFTSGSTGRSQPNRKTWGSIVSGAAINSQYFLPKASPAYLLATVPAQHMWGLETSVYLPLFSSICVSDAQPLFAQDIINHLNKLPEPRLFVSTPVHLRYLLASKLSLPSIERVLCATSPLTQLLAVQIEEACKGELIEIYGCSEIGSMAYRRTAVADYWATFEGLDFKVTSEGETQVFAQHLPINTVALQDLLSFKDATHFQLIGRHSDAINIAGKRGSMTEITDLLLAIDGVQDAAVLLVDKYSTGHQATHPQNQNEQNIEKLVALVVANIEKPDIIEALREHLDPVFIPKSLYLVERLPRETSGKLSRQALLDLVAQCSS